VKLHPTPEKLPRQVLHCARVYEEVMPDVVIKPDSLYKTPAEPNLIEVQPEHQVIGKTPNEIIEETVKVMALKYNLSEKEVAPHVVNNGLVFFNHYYGKGV